MKKLKLNLQHIEGAEVLTREQLKKVMGGDPDGSGGAGSGGRSCCIRGSYPNSSLTMTFKPITVQSQTECSQKAAEAVAAGWTNVHYHTDCDGK